MSLQFPHQFYQFSILLCITIIWMLLTGTRSINGGDALWEILRVANIYLFFLVAFFLLRDSENLIRVLSRAGLFAVLSFSIYGLIQLIPLWHESRMKNLPIQIDLRIGSTLGNKNFFSEVMVMLLPLQGIGFLYASKRWRILFGLGILISFSWIILLQSMASWLAITISLLLVPLYTGTYKDLARLLLNSRQKKLLLAFASLLSIIIAVAIFSKSNTLHLVKGKAAVAMKYVNQPELLNSTGRVNDNSVFERILIWRNSIELIKEYPLLGAGLNNWKLLQAQHGIGGTAYLNTGMVQFEHPHNDYLLILSEQGPMGLLLYLLFFIFLLITIRKSIRQSKDQKSRILFVLLGFSILSFAIMSFFGYPRSRFYAMLILMTYSALVFIFAGKSEKPPLTCPKVIIRIFVLICAVISISGSYAAWYRLRGEIHTKEMLKAQFSKNYARMLREAEKAETYFYKMDLTATPMAWYKGMAYFYSGQVGTATQHFEIAEKINPYHLRILNDLGTCYEKSGEHEKAIEKYRAGLSIAPVFTEGLLNLSATYFNTGQIDSAFSTIDRVQKMKISLRESENYSLFLEAILKAKVKKYLEKRYDSTQMEEDMKIVNEQIDLSKIYNQAKSNNLVFVDLFENELREKRQD